MKGYLKYFILIFSGIILLFFLVGLLLPKEFVVVRSHTVEAPPADITPYVDDLRYWPEWTAWNAERDPSIEFTYSENTTGLEATQNWKGDLAGEGRVTIRRQDVEKGLFYEMVIGEERIVIYGNIDTKQLDNGQTKVTWTKEGRLKNNPLMGFQALLIDGSLGPELEEGLEKLKRLAEQGQSK